MHYFSNKFSKIAFAKCWELSVSSAP